MKETGSLFVIQLDRQRYALHLKSVSRVVRMVEITTMPKAPASILGVVNIQGDIIPVIDLRACLGHRQRPAVPEDVLVIAETPGARVALAADEIVGVVAAAEGGLLTEQEMPRQSEFLEGVVKLQDGLVMVCDLGRIVGFCGDLSEESAGTPQRSEFAVEVARLNILRERARKLALEPVREEGGERLEIVEFTLSGEEYAIESGFIREVYPLKELTPLPCTPPFVLGIVNLRGKILSVIDLRKFFELPDRGLSDLNKVIVLEHGKMEFGVLADAIVGVRTMRASELQPALPTLTDRRGEYLRGVTAERLVVLDAARMLADRRIVVHEEV